MGVEGPDGRFWVRDFETGKIVPLGSLAHANSIAKLVERKLAKLSAKEKKSDEKIVDFEEKAKALAIKKAISEFRRTAIGGEKSEK